LLVAKCVQLVILLLLSVTVEYGLILLVLVRIILLHSPSWLFELGFSWGRLVDSFRLESFLIHSYCLHIIGLSGKHEFFAKHVLLCLALTPLATTSAP